MMEYFCRQLEIAITKLHTSDSAAERKQCEDFIIKFRNATHPYELCKHILGTSRNSQMLYEVAKCLSNAVVREWNTVLCPNGGQLNTANMNSSLPYQLLCYLLQWVASYGNEIAAFARQSILGAVAAIVKRSAAAEAQCNIGQESLHREDDTLLTLMSPPFENPGPASPLVTFFLHELTNFIAPIPTSSNYQQEFSRLSFGLSILSSFLDEMSNADQDATNLNLPLETHVYMQARFQGFELLQIFQMLLHLVESLLSARDWPTANAENDETTYRLIHCLEVITSWSFLPERVFDFACLRRRAKRSSSFRPSELWACVVGVDAISTTLSLFLKLHSRLRRIPSYCSRILTSIISLTSITGPLIMNKHCIGNTAAASSTCSLTEHACICMNGLALALFSPYHQPLAGVNALLLPNANDLAISLQLRIDGITNEFASPCPRAAEIKAAFQPIADASISTSGFLSYELPLLAELSLNLLQRLVEVCIVVRGFATGHGWPASDVSGSQRAVLSRLVFYISAVNAFLGLVKTILLECLILESNVSVRDEATSAADISNAAHESSERILACLSDLVEAIPNFDASNAALSYTTGSSATLDRMVGVLKHACGQIRINFQRHQHDLIRVYFASHLASPVGFRKDIAQNTQGGYEEEELDLNIDEDDQTAYEDSLFAIGQFSNFSESGALASVVEVLVGLLEDRARLLFSYQAEAQPPYALLEDLHWLLLFVGHILVSGPSQIGSSRGAQPAWDSNFSIPVAMWSIVPRTFMEEDIERCRQYLLQAIDNETCNEAEEMPALLRLFAALFRLLRVQVTARVGSAQLTEDTLWVFVRLTLTYFSYKNLNGSEGHLDDCLEHAILPEGEVTLFRALFHPPSSGRSGHATANSIHYHLILAHASTALTRCASLAMATWLGEPTVTAFASSLLAAIARHSLSPDSSRSGESAITSSPAQTWIELCRLVCSSEMWPCLRVDTLAELVDACARGCWCLRDAHRVESTSSDIFYQFVEELRKRLSHLIVLDDEGGSGGGGGGQMVDPSLLPHIIAGLSTLRGLARALRWIVAHGGNCMSNASSVAATGLTDTDLVGFLWTSVFLPILQNCSTYFVQRYHMCHEVMVALLSLFEEIADNCLLYLANCPATLTTEVTNGAFELAGGLHLRFPPPHTGSTQFFILTIIVCSLYARINSKKVTVSKEANEEQVTELRVLFSTLKLFLSHEFELRLYGVMGTEPESNSADASGGDEGSLRTTVDVTIFCIGFLLPLLSQSLLAVPELADSFYHLLAYSLELHPEGLLHLTRNDSVKMLPELGRLLRHGVFDLAETTVNISALEALTYLIEFCSTHRSDAATIVSQLSLGGDLLREIFSLVTRDVFPAQLEDSLSGCIFAMAALDLRGFEEVTSECVSRCSGDVTSQQRLQRAFNHLSVPLTTTDAMMAERIRRNDFQRRFHAFVPTVRAFLCSL